MNKRKEDVHGIIGVNLISAFFGCTLIIQSMKLFSDQDNYSPEEYDNKVYDCFSKWYYHSYIKEKNDIIYLLSFTT